MRLFSAVAVTDEVQAGGSGSYNGNLPASLVFPFRTAFAPRLGVALRLPKQTVVRAGFGINYTVASTPPLPRPWRISRPLPTSRPTKWLQNARPRRPIAFRWLTDFPRRPRWATTRSIRTTTCPTCRSWNLDVQKTLPWGVVLNIGYNGSKGNHLDITSAPRASASSPNTDPTNLIFNYEQAAAFSKFNAGHSGVNKRLEQRHCAGRQLPVLALHRRCRLGGRHIDGGGAELAGPDSRGR